MNVGNLASKKEEIGLAINREDNGLYQTKFCVRTHLNEKSYRDLLE